MAQVSSQTSFAQWLKERRKALDVTQEELAERIGCARETIKKIELGERRPSRQIADLLARYFQVPADEQAAFVHFARSASALPALPASGATGDSAEGSGEETGAPWREQRRRHTNLPASLSRLIGRAREVAELRKQLLSERTRLVTLTGPPGIGKTRLALEVAERLAYPFDDGVYLVELAPISDPDLVVNTISSVLSVNEAPAPSSIESLKDRLSGKRMLLVLDNFEQVIEAAPLVGDLLLASPWLKVLVTSREPLRLRGERTFPVPPLAVPGREPRAGEAYEDRDPLRLAAEYAAVDLFVERARDANAGFELTSENAQAVVAICARLDGLPLAIELVAARATMLSPLSVLQQLSDRQVLLIGGLRGLPTRHRTLQNAISWSYDLLDDAEKALFRRLGVFVGGCALQAAEAISDIHGDMPAGVGDTASSLVGKSLLHIQREGGQSSEGRLTMLETIREYALERLRESGEWEALRHRHGEYFLDMAEQAERHLTGAEQLIWAPRLEAEQDNLRAVLSMCLPGDEALAPGEGSRTSPELSLMGLRLAGALSQFWASRGNLGEGLAWLRRALHHTDSFTGVEFLSTSDEGIGSPDESGDAGAATLGTVPTERSEGGEGSDGQQMLLRARVRALNGIGVLGRLGGDFSEARRALEAGVEISRSLGDERELAVILNNLGVLAMLQGDYGEARRYLQEMLAIRRELGLELEVGYGLTQLGNVAIMEEDYDEANALLREGLVIKRRAGDMEGIGHSLHSLAMVARRQGDLDEAWRLDQETLGIARELDNKPGMAYSLRDLGNVAFERGDYPAARDLFTQGLTLFRELEDALPTTECLIGIARTLARTGEPARATRLFGAVDAALETIRGQLDPADREAHAQDIALLESELGKEQYASEWQRGQAMSLDRAITEANEQA